MSSSNSPCAACKGLRRKCTQECVFAPYFPPEQPQKFANVHKVFGASNVTKLLNELNAVHREDAVNSLAYEAETRLQNPVYGCVGLISLLQQQLKLIQSDIYKAKKELTTYIGPTAMLPILTSHAFMPQQHPGNPPSSSVIRYNMSHMTGIPIGPSHRGQLAIREPQQQQQQMFETQQFAAALAREQQTQQFAEALATKEQQEMFQTYEQQQHQQPQEHELMMFNSSFDPTASVTASGFNQMTADAISPSVALGTFDKPYHIQSQQLEHPHHHQLQTQLLLQPQPQQQQQQAFEPVQQHQGSGSDEDTDSCPTSS